MLRTRLQIGALLLTLCALATATVGTASAQDRNVVAPSAADRVAPNTADRDDDGFDAGWLGLLGLVGLAGLAGRNRNHTRHATTREDAVAHR